MSVANLKRLRIEVKGIVQGVGFRPFVYQLAHRLGLKGWVLNSTEGVTIEVEGTEDLLERFIEDLKLRRPRLARIDEIQVNELPPADYRDFTIRKSQKKEDTIPVIPPDAAICQDCLRELFDPEDRRYRYPFINCTYCGPRYSIILALPYDRPNTTMREFQMCEDCKREYEDPMDRRFHAQPVACPVCGPKLILLSPEGEVLAEKEEALRLTAEYLRDGKIIALKGLGGYQILVDARNEEAIKDLRRRKRRPTKPFALMMKDMDMVRRYCYVSHEEEELLRSIQAPIVLLEVKDFGDISQEVAPGANFLGVMLPYTPLHVLLMDMIDFPIVCTSGNISEEPICISEEEALSRLKGIPDYLLANNRPIARHVDDSLTFLIRTGEEPSEYVLRRARGYAPMPLVLSREVSLRPTLALGPQLKNTVALAKDNWVVVSQHIGDLDNFQTQLAFQRTLNDLLQFLRFEPEVIAVDLHPDYHTTSYGERLAEEKGAKLVRVQHHYAHLVSLMMEALSRKTLSFEDALDHKFLGISWDGTGYGLDGTIWGGEILYFNLRGFSRVGHLKPFFLVGGDKAVKEPWRVGTSLVMETFPESWDSILSSLNFPMDKVSKIYKLFGGKFSVKTTSMGRLFDGISAIIGLKQVVSYEAEGAIALEWRAWRYLRSNNLSFTDLLNLGYEPVIEKGTMDWRSLVEDVISDLRRGVDVGEIALKFHGWVLKLISRISEEFELRDGYLFLSGGCFQNRLIMEGISEILSKKGIRLVHHREYPTNDGGVSLGQVAVGALSD